MIPNITLVIQGIVFFAVVWLVMKFIWPHIIAAIEERQAKIAEGLAAADRARQELADADSRVADEIRKARVEAVAIVDKASHQAGQIVPAKNCGPRLPHWLSLVPRRSSSARSTPMRTRICSTNS